MKMLMVCLGNICRSPLAEGILRHRVQNLQPAWFIDSAGTAGYHTGDAPHPLSIKTARHHGIDISHLQARTFEKKDMDRFDRIWVMDRSNYADVQRISGSRWQPGKTDLILNLLYPGEDREVPDPWYGTEKDYHSVFEMLDAACRELVCKFRTPGQIPS
jgi:protein-tyrosine phosphatase